GEKISPREIDELLLAHPDVAEAVAFGVPHPAWGEEVEAAVVLKGAASEPALVAFCRERLADFKVPKKIHIVDSIPRTATGKVQRRAVAAASGGGGACAFSSPAPAPSAPISAHAWRAPGPTSSCSPAGNTPAPCGRRACGSRRGARSSSSALRSW